MEQNHPTFFIVFWAILKIGAIPAIININLSEDPLLHCLSVAESSLFLFDPMYENQVATIANAAHEKGMRLAAYGEATEFDDTTTSNLGPALTPNVLSKYSDEDTDESLIRGVALPDLGILMYTRYVHNPIKKFAFFLILISDMVIYSNNLTNDFFLL